MPDENEVDVIIGGGGVAGVATAAALHQLGHRILLVEPGLNDCRRLAGEVFHPPGVAGLADLGLLAPLLRAPTARILGFSMTPAGTGCKHVRIPYDEVPSHRAPGLGIEHGLIRQCLLDAVSELPGVTTMRGKRVIAVEQNDRSGAVVRVGNGKKNVERYRCRMLVAADGAQSRLARSVGIGSRCRRISTMFGYRLSIEHLPEPDYGHVILGAQAPILAYPISACDARILFDLPHNHGRLPQPQDCADAFAVLSPRLRQEMERAFAMQPRMSGITQASIPDRMVRDRIVLVGDAAGSCHPLTASGMTRCISDALLLRDTLAAQPHDWQRALQTYERHRRWPQATRLLLADALHEAFCGPTPVARIVRRGVLAYCGTSKAGRATTMALLSTADGRPFTLICEVIQVMAQGFLAHLRGPMPPDRGGIVPACRILKGLVKTVLGHVRQILDSVPMFARRELQS
jgi:2-polyprenyl-6-methoxyphenol hydroxylase-like FAD-dependent oxidoreductase